MFCKREAHRSKPNVRTSCHKMRTQTSGTKTQKKQTTYVENLQRETNNFKKRSKNAKTILSSMWAVGQIDLKLCKQLRVKFLRNGSKCVRSQIFAQPYQKLRFQTSAKKPEKKTDNLFFKLNSRDVSFAK